MLSFLHVFPRLNDNHTDRFLASFKLLVLMSGVFVHLLLFSLNTAFSAQQSDIESPAMARPGLLNESGFYNGVKRLSPSEIYTILPDVKGKAVFLEFRSKFCKACKQMDPHLKVLLPQYPHIEKRIYDIVRDKAKSPAVFDAFQPAVVPIQLYITTRGEVVNVFYDYHDKKELNAALGCINPGESDGWCKQLFVLQKDQNWFSETMTQITSQINSIGSTNSLLIIALAFAGGIVTSFFPCTVALLPVLVGYMGGYSGGSKRDIALQVLVFILGLASVMAILGVVLSLLGFSFGAQSNMAVYIAVGVLCIVMALQMLEWINLPLPQAVKQLPETQPGKILSFYILGCAFGLVASPCGTPVLAAILGVIAKQGNIALGGVSLFAYALGQGVLLLIVGLFTGFLKHKATMMKIGVVLTRMSALLLLLVGLAYIVQSFGLLPDWVK